MEDKDKDSKVEISSKVLVAAITAIVTIFGSLTVYVGNKDSVQADIFNTNLQIARQYQESNMKLIEDNANKALKILDLEIKIRELENRKGTIESYIEDIPAPVWIKQLNKDKMFEMLHLNKQYLSNYGIDKRTYIGKTDYDFWPKEVADTFRDEDFEVYLSGRSIVRLVKIPLPNGKTEEQLFMKFRVHLEDGDFGVGGILLDIKER